MRLGKIVSSSPAPVRKARESSLGVKGAKIFNLLPAELRNTGNNTVDIFKKKLDIFLANIPDQPTIAGMGKSHSLF